MKRKEKLEQINREARAVVRSLAAIILFWTIAGFGISRFNITVFHTPLWAITGCLGTWIFAVVLVCWLVKHVFRDFSLDEESESDDE